MKNPFKNKEDRAGLYITIIFHLVVIIVLLAYQIDNALRREESFVLDFTKQEEIEKQKKEQIFKEDISKRIEEMLAAARNSGEPVRNVAVDANTQLKDDRNTDADQLYKDAERLANELKSGQLEDAREEAVELPAEEKKKKEDPKKKEFKGKAVVTYNLEGRKASSLKIPAYRCYDSGDVTVIITVNNAGRVVGAKILEEISSSDACLRSEAIRAARTTRFNSSPSSPPNQTGEILYRFIAQ